MSDSTSLTKRKLQLELESVLSLSPSEMKMPTSPSKAREAVNDGSKENSAPQGNSKFCGGATTTTLRSLASGSPTNSSINAFTAASGTVHSDANLEAATPTTAAPSASPSPSSTIVAADNTGRMNSEDEQTAGPSQCHMREFNVPCKVSLKELANICRRDKITCSQLKRESPPIQHPPAKRSPNNAGENEYEVEKVVEIRCENSKIEFLVKWKEYDDSYNKWVPLHHLYCHQMIVDRLIETAKSKKLLAAVIHHIVKVTLLDNPVLDLKIANKLLDKRLVVITGHSKKSLDEIRRHLKRLDSSELLRRIEYKFRDAAEFVRQMLERQDYMDQLDEWRLKIDDMLGPSANGAVFVENFVDNEDPPWSFKFITDYIYAPGISIERVRLGCSCEKCSEGDCGNKHNGGERAYNDDGTLTREWLKSGSGVVECNESCACSIECYNRVTQRGCQLPVTIFKTDDGRGWGLRTNVAVPARSFVMEYLGEVITSDMASQRKDTYLFDLDFNVDREAEYTVDAFHYGNASHFINHSCEPNLVVVPVWVNNLDLMMPRLAFFAKRQIKKYEELTFDYCVRVKESGTLDVSRASADDTMTGGANDAGQLLFKCLCKQCQGRSNGLATDR